MKQITTCDRSFWARAQLLRYVRTDLVGTATAAALANRLLRDPIADVAVVAADVMLEHGLALERPYTDANLRAQNALRAAKVIGRVTRAEDPIRDMISKVLRRNVQRIDWKTILGSDYRDIIPKVARWRAYSRTDATSWVNLTDTLMDIVLDKLAARDGSIGQYRLGEIGSFLSSGTSRFAKKYPQLHSVASRVHELRTESDLSHPITRATGRHTNYIRYEQMECAKPDLAAGWLEMWNQW